MRFILFIGFGLLLHGKVSAQKEFTSKLEHTLYYFDYKAQQFTVLSDSTGCYRYDVQSDNWIFHPLKLELEETFDRFCSLYIAISAPGGKVYFVDKGCGMLYHLVGDTIRRIDKSSHHQNQYDGNYFIYQGKPYVFGGYGLFQMKNLLTHFELEDGEWFSTTWQKQIVPTARISSLFQVNGNQLYVAGGYSKNGGKISTFKDVWVYNFVHNRWKNLGALTFAYPSGMQDPDRINQQDILCTTDSVYVFDFKKNSYSVYPVLLEGKLKRLVRVGKYVLLVKKHSRNNQFAFLVKDANVYFSSPARTGKIFQKKPTNGIIKNWLVAAGVFCVVILFWWFVRRKEKSRDPKVSELPLQFEPVLQFFVAQYPRGVEIAMFNDIVNYDHPSLDTLKKRRENLLKEFKQFVSNQFHLSLEEVVREEKHPSDRRIKLLFLHETVVHHYLNQKKGK